MSARHVMKYANGDRKNSSHRVGISFTSMKKAAKIMPMNSSVPYRQKLVNVWTYQEEEAGEIQARDVGAVGSEGGEVLQEGQEEAEHSHKG